MRLQGREFAEAHPQLTRFLSEQSTDPDVERLLEGFAFLTGKLREKVEDEFPELTHSLLNMLWPNYLEAGAQRHRPSVRSAAACHQRAPSGGHGTPR